MQNDVIAAELRRLEQAGGRLDPHVVVEEARCVDSPLHSAFDWDDGSAAEKYRLQQARTLIRSIRLDVTVRDVPLSTVAYVRDPDAAPATAGYRSVCAIRSDEEAARSALLAEMQRLNQTIKRVKSLAAALHLNEETENIERAVRSLGAGVAAQASA